MSFELKDIVPWARSYDEYVAMFALSPDDLQKKILGCGDGPAGFNCGMARSGRPVVSVDPLFQFSEQEIRSRIDATFEAVMDQTEKNKNEFVWDKIKTVQQLGELRLGAMNLFLSDYAAGKAEGRYKPGSLPKLEFSDKRFDIALCSHFLFLYSVQMSEDFHVRSIRELCRVAREVRIFPLLELGSVKSRYLDRVIQRMETAGFRIEIIQVPYEFQKGGNEMMKVVDAA